jgi:hypothetical protein
MPTESTYPKLDIPNVDLWTFLFERKGREFPDDKGTPSVQPGELALTEECTVIYVDADTNRSYTYAQVRSTALDFGKGLKSVWEWKKGDVLGIYSPNCIDTPAITWGTHWAGGILSPANPGYTVEELAFQLKDSGAKALVTQKVFLKTAIKACKKVGIDESHIILMGDERDETMKFKHFTSIQNLAGTSRYRKTKIDPNKDLAFLVYSSGTTGHPKGVMLSHTNIISNVCMLRIAEGTHLSWKGQYNNEGDKLLAFLPFFHIYVSTLTQHPKSALTHPLGPHMLNPPSDRRGPHPRRNVKIRPREILLAHPIPPHNICLRRPACDPPTREGPRSIKIQLVVYPHDEFRGSAPNKRPCRNRLLPPQNPH